MEDSIATQQVTSERVAFYLENKANLWRFLDTLSKDEAPNSGIIMRSPWLVISTTVGYLLFVCFLGPAFMRKRPAYKLKNVIRAYNLFEVILSTILFHRVTKAVGGSSTFFSFDNIFSFHDGSSDGIFQMGELILMARLSELLDTVFFTLRKKTNQVTFLHVYHHAFVPFYAYWILRSAPTRFNLFIFAMNSFIHMLMYSYYLLATFENRAAFDPESSPKSLSKRESFVASLIARLLRFKKYMTQLQLLQFVVLVFYSLWPIIESYYRGSPCPVPGRYLGSNLYLALSFLGLFLHFYMRSYGNKKRINNEANGSSIKNKAT